MNEDKQLTTPIIIGRLGATYGVRGWLKVNSFTEPFENILQYKDWQYKFKGQWQPLPIKGVKPHGKLIIAQVEGYNDKEHAAALTGCEIGINREQLPETQEGEYYWSDLEGLTVVNTQGITLGTVINMMNNSANDLMVVKGEKEHLIPYITGHFVLNVDLEKKEILVNWDEDFL